MNRFILQTKSVQASWDKTQVLFDVSANFMQGQWTCIVGPNGAGKSSLLQVLAGLIPARGEVLLHGQSLHQMSVKQRALALAWLGQQALGHDDLRVVDVVMLGRLPHQSWWTGATDEDHAVVEELLQTLELIAWRDRSLGSLSGGERQRVLLARALAVQAPVLLMDEPIANVDAPHQADWLATVQQLTQAGTTVISVLHDLNLALRADQVLVMQAGRVLLQAAPGDPALHACLQQVFDQRLSFHQVQRHWIAMVA
jgi:iron complex transport system ATP-binding protein